MRTSEELLDLDQLTLKDKLTNIAPVEKDCIINRLLMYCNEIRFKLHTLTELHTGKENLDFVVVSQPDFQITFFGKAEEEPFDDEQYVYIEGYLNHKKVESRRFKVSDINKLDQKEDSSIDSVDIVIKESPIQNPE